MNSRGETIAPIYPGHAAMSLAQRLALILLGMPSHAATTDTNLSAGHVQSPCNDERTLREKRKVPASPPAHHTPFGLCLVEELHAPE